MDGFTLGKFAVLCGIIGYACLCVSFLTGMRIVKLPAKYRVHRLLGITGFIFITVHVVIMLAG